MNENNKPHIAINRLSMYLYTENSSIYINKINSEKDSEDIVLYNSYFGGLTPSNSNGVEYLLEPISDWFMNDTVDVL